MEIGSPLVRHVRVGVYVRELGRLVTDVVLPPGFSVIVGSSTNCTVPVPNEVGVDQQLIIEHGRHLHFHSGMRLHMMADVSDEHVAGTAEELEALGLRSPAALRWHRLNVTLRPGISVFVKYLPLPHVEETIGTK